MITASNNKDNNYTNITQDIRNIISKKLDMDTNLIDTVIRQTGGNNTKQLLYNIVAAYLILKSPKNKIPRIKDIVISSIKLNKRIPKSIDLLKIFILPIFCNERGINVTYENMNKCVTKNIHKSLDSKNVKKYIDLLDLNKKDKLTLKEYDRRVSNMHSIVKF
jgi:hypothetical protein